MYELWEDENVLIDDIAEDVDIFDPPFAMTVANEMLPARVEDLMGIISDNETYTQFFEDTSASVGRLKGINVVVGFDATRKYDDIPGLGEDETIYYADIYEVGHPTSGHNTLAFVALISERMNDAIEEKETMQWLYSRACELFMEEAGIADYYTNE